jgi:polyisoprenoid-binding protein YceI
MKKIILAAAAASLVAFTAAAQAPAGKPGAAEVSRVAAGTYKVDPAHTMVVWEVDHLGLSPLYGLFGEATGTLTLDPANPGAAKVDVTLPLSGLKVTSPGFDKHLRTPDFFDEAKFPNARFVSTSVKATGSKATITGDLTVHGVTKPVTLDATFFGAGDNPMSKAKTVGFTATAKIKRSDFGLGMAAPFVSDEVDLKITAAFEKQG